ncbi:MAG: tRNA-dihydrouridine synthase family protein [Planctomycetales bacterium]|nr:tRNA-dihydrouridine synthase family protein [Planctomycetales bacterium]
MNPLALGRVDIGFPVVQAALSGYSDWPMRVIARRLGAPYTICEVMLDKFVLEVSRGSKRRRLLKVTAEEHPVGAQLMGAEPSQFGLAASQLVEAGFDVIDINFGCPVKKVLGRCRGGFHLSQPPVALEIVARVREAVPDPVPVTVKMRRGIDDSAESHEKFLAILNGAFDLGVAAVTVHGRTVQQRYIGPSRWDFLADLKRHVGDRTILGSGDLFSPQACLEMIRQTGVDGVTVARGAIGNPWIFSQASALARGQPLPDPPGLIEQREVISEHYRLAEETYGPPRAGRLMRKFGIKYSRLHPDAVQVRDAFVQVRQHSDWERVLERWYAEDRPGVHPPAEADIAGTPGGVV